MTKGGIAAIANENAVITTEATATTDHPFAGFLRTIGRGPKLSRPLTEDEAEQAMALILAGAVEPAQIGALFLLLRFRAETPAELAGFVRAARSTLPDRAGLTADLDWPSYADRHKQLPYFVLAALLLAESGVRVAMHGIASVGTATTPAVLSALGIAPSANLTDAARALDRDCFAYLPIEHLHPPLAGLFTLRPVLGVRSPANTFARDLNPLAAAAQIQGVFHPTYIPTHQDTVRLLGQPRAAIFKGGGGEAQRNPEKTCRVGRVDGDILGEEEWPAMTADRPHRWRDEDLDPGAVVELWRGTRHSAGPEAAIIGTAAIALRLLDPACDQQSALAKAEMLWRDRPKTKYGQPAGR
ncbi:MAG: glycosyl transferase family protein [Alphaproteobacteria bacterium]|nr:glycosyl transferase family protein [Alphaproteobacteria bacterium]